MKSPAFLTRPLAAFATLLLACSGAMAQDQEQPSGWPLIFTSGDYQVQVFKPQPESFDGTSFTARAAVALQRPQDTNPVFGAIWGNGVLAVDRSSRMGTLTTFKVTDARFPGLTDTAELDRIKAMLSTGIQAHAAPIAIDWLVAALAEEKQSTASYENAPPQIIYKDKPSILVYIDGTPVFETIKDQGNGTNDAVYAGSGPTIDRVVNTPYFLVRPKGDALWLYGSGLWYSAKAIEGPWQYEQKAPANLVKLAKQVDTTKVEPRTDGIIPEVVVTTKPTVLLDVNGTPQMKPYDSSSLMYVTNTDKDLFLEIPTQEYYLLASGRWYATKDLKNGPWRFVPSDALPTDFAKVPEGSAKDGILAHVAGTQAAREAVRDASIPQTAQVNRSTASVTVTYDGAPQFNQIPGTSIYSAANASTTVLRINGAYHVCDNAVWYEGNTPDGPWTVSTSVPAEVNDIPPTDPAYRVRYVYIYDYTPDVVFVGYTPGYLGSYVQYGTVVYGTGYYYNPWRSTFWYPRPYTWGFNMYYNPWYGWGFGASWGYDWLYPSWNYYGYYRPYSWGWWGPYAYCPGTVHGWNHGYYGHRPGLTGPSGSSGGRLAGNPQMRARNTDLYLDHRQPGVRSSTINRGEFNARSTDRVAQERNPATQGKAMRPITGDHFTDSNGNVYRSREGRTEELMNGSWQNIGNNQRTPAENGGRQQGNAAGPGSRPITMPEQNGRRPDLPQANPGRTQERPNSIDPQRIERERMRGEQRWNDFQGYQRERETAPRQQFSMPRSEPGFRSSPSMPSAPSRGGNWGGGGGGRGTSPRR